MKIWAKTVQGEKITRSFLYETPYVGTDNYEECLREICHEMDVPTPVVTPVNVRNFTNFNIERFRPRDFVESVDFDFFETEFVPDKKDKRS